MEDTVAFRTDERFARRRRELRTLEAMMRMYCRHYHRAQPLCAECGALARYAQHRLERCLFGDAKPTCAKCLVHCYRVDMRDRVRAIMRWAGPRIVWRHPLLAILHTLDSRRPAIRPPERPPERPPTRD